MIEHPTYPNPTIREAICEIHFALPGDKKWSPLYFGEFFKEIQDEFPQIEPTESDATLRLQAGPEGVTHRLVPPVQRMRYVNPHTSIITQLANGIFNVNILPTYPGWQAMRNDILRIWQKAVAVLHPERITRIGLRYINFIPRSRIEEKPGDWLKPNDYLPGMVRESLPGFLSRTEVRPKPDIRLIVTIAEAAGSIPPIVFDIDCIIERNIATDQDSIQSVIDQLHDMEWEVFSRSISDRLEDLLKKG